MYIYPYKPGSASAKVLAQTIGGRRIRHHKSRFKGGENKTVINWGCSELPEEVLKCNVINHPNITNIASNKLKFFEAIESYNNELEDGNDYDNYLERFVRIPDFTTDKGRAQRWSHGLNIHVVIRHKLTGNSGEGIQLVEPKEFPRAQRGGMIAAYFDDYGNVVVPDAVEEDKMPDAPLYVKYVPKKQEYRVHVAKGEVVDLQRKARRRDVPDDKINWRIRNHDNGFIFQRNDLEVPDDVKHQALNACKAIGLDFGAVDVIFNEKEQQAYVLEVNTAPGLTGQTLEGYAERFRNWNA